MVYLTFYWDSWAIFEGDEIFRMIQRDDYEADTWQKCCDKCLNCLDWDDSDLVKGNEDKVIDTNRHLREISVHENGKEFDAPKEIYDYFQSLLSKMDKTEVKTKQNRQKEKIN